MNTKMNEKPKFLTILFNVLFFGALWGIVEATLGTLLHLPFFDKFGMYMASTTIVVPIAYYLMANCYKKTGSLYSVALMGVVASLIKLCVAFVVGFRPSVYNPAIYILVEALAMMGGLAIFRPKNVLSLRSLAAVIVANTTYQFSYLMINMAMGGTNIFASEKAWQLVGEKYLFTFNYLAILYVFASGAITYLILKLLAKFNFEMKFDINRLISSPITASIAMVVAISTTILLAAF